MQHDYDESFQFLQLLYPEHPWMLTSISPDKKSINSQTFLTNEREDVLRWLELYSRRNIYYSVNQPIESARQKRKLLKSDIASVHYLHVDVDPRTGEDLETEQTRILAQIESYRIEPTSIVFSGGGYNALWRLDEPVLIADGAASAEEAVERAIDVERRNWQFELDFSTPDHCRDVSRILRLPGTINWPSAEKVAKGRLPALARLIRHTGCAYPLSTFAATPVASTQRQADRPGRVVLDIEHIESLDHLKIPEKLKVIITQGFDPEEPDRWKSRSDALFWVCCELVRSGIPDEQTLGIITDKRYEISASVLDKGSGVTRYALRQVQRARDNADHPMLAQMNDEYAVIMSLGSVVLVEDGRVNAHTGRTEPVFMEMRKFRDRIKHYPPIMIDIGEKTRRVSAYDWWTSHPRRRMYKDIAFEPGLETPGRYNLWTGFSVQPQPGERHLRLLEHLFENICLTDQALYDYLIGWMARVVQEPRSQSMTAPVLLGARGTGKSIFCDFFSSLFDPHRYTASDVTQLTARFNAHLGQCLVVVAEEAFDLSDRRHESVLKELITGRTIGVEKKNIDRFQLPNYVHLIMTSNNERVVPAGDYERRFFVLRVGTRRMQDSEYFGAILRDQRNGGLSNLLHHLMLYDLSRFDVTRVPYTDALRDQQEHSLSSEIEWLLGKLETGQWFKNGRSRWEGPVRKRELHEDYLAYMQEIGIRRAKGERSFHKFIMAELPATDGQVYGRDSHDRPMVFYFPSLAECREAFDKRRGWKTRWREIGDEPTREGADVIHLPGKAFE